MSDAVLSHETLARIGAGDLESLTDEYGRIIESSRYSAVEHTQRGDVIRRES